MKFNNENIVLAIWLLLSVVNWRRMKDNKHYMTFNTNEKKTVFSSLNAILKSLILT